MKLLNFLTSLFDSLFKGSSVDAKTKGELRRIEADLKKHVPAIYKNGCLMANVAEAFILLYTNTKYIEEILSSTIKSSDTQRVALFVDRLIMTGFSQEALDLQQQLLFDNRKAEVLESNLGGRVYENHGRSFERLMQILKGEEFLQINDVIARLFQLCDVCRFNYFSVIRVFLPNFTDAESAEKMEIKNIPVSEFESALSDLYYLVHDFQVTGSMAKAVVALATFLSGAQNVDSNSIVDNLKKISYIFRHVLEPETIMKLVMVSRKDPNVKLETGSYSCSVLPNFIEQMRKQYEADTKRIKIEVQDETIANEIQLLFGDRQLCMLEGYNAEQNEVLIDSGVDSFSWITPMQILHTFLSVYISDNIKSLLNDIIVEGFFSNATLKTDFSTAVFAVLESGDRVRGFEQNFSKGQPYDINTLKGYAIDSHVNPEVGKLLAKNIGLINAEAHKILQQESVNILNLYKYLVEMLEDARLISPVNITNVKVLLTSSRNKENTYQLEGQIGDWKIFMSIMRNYVALGEVED